jgi:lysophospholipase L1-like esterase
MDRKEIVKQVSKEIGYGFFDCLFQKHALESHNYIIPINVMKEVFLWVGDSRIAGGDWNNLHITKKIPIDNKAIGGTRAREWSKRVCLQLIIDMYPKMILIGVGGNDVGSGQSFQSIIGDIQKMIFAIKNYCPYTVIFLHCCLPVLVHGKATNTEVREFNRQLEILAGCNEIEYIDLFDDFNCLSAQTIQVKNSLLVLHDAIDIKYVNMEELPFYARSKDRLPVHLNAEGYKYWYALLNELCIFI